ncbi:MAG: MATE family efflux transporter [Solobacterium sp.]|nr:MATE family efflux transporter [Solobacterium sp.]
MGKAEDRNLLTVGDFRKKIILFALPIFIGNLFQQLYNTVDSLIVGNYLGPRALAAVSSTGSYVFLVIGFFIGLSMGAGTVIARNIGAGDRIQVERSVHTAVALGLTAAVLMSFFGVFCSEAVLKLMGTPADVFPLSAAYLKVYFAGAAGLVMYNTFVGILQAAGDSRHPLVYLIVSSVINIFLDLLFVAVFHMGVEGAALATVISQIFSALLAMRRLVRTDANYGLRIRKIGFDPFNLKEILRFGVPTAVQACVVDLSNMMIQTYINSFGSMAMAGIGAYSKLEGFAFLPVSSFSIAMSTFVSQNIGADNRERAGKGIVFGLLTAVLLIEAIGLTMYLFAPQLVSFFSRDPEVIVYGVGRAKVCTLFFCLMGFSNISSSIMRGLGKPVAPLVIMLVCWCAVRVIVLMTVGQVWHNILLVYWIYPFTWTLSSVTYILYYGRLKKQGVF